MMRIASAVAVLGLLVTAPLRAEGPQVKFGGLFYAYNFFWQNADLDDATNDGDFYWYLHGDIRAMADFGNGVCGVVKVGAWGPMG